VLNHIYCHSVLFREILLTLNLGSGGR